MPELQEVLREETFKGQVDDDAYRVFCTLTAKKRLELHRTINLVSGLVQLLREKGVLSEDELDELLLSILG